MIRRNPTLIPMTDLDVQDVRDMVAKQKAEAQNLQLLMVKLKRISDNPETSVEDKQKLAEITAGYEAMKDKARRIGLDPGPSAP